MIFVLLAVLVTVSFLFMSGMKGSAGPEPVMSQSQLPSKNNVDKLLDEMEFGTIAFNAPYKYQYR